MHDWMAATIGINIRHILHSICSVNSRGYIGQRQLSWEPLVIFFLTSIFERLCWWCLTVARVWRQCYDLFRGAYPDIWKDILERSQEVNDCVDTSKTVAQRQQLFNKNVRKLTQTVSIHIFYSRQWGSDEAPVSLIVKGPWDWRCIPPWGESDQSRPWPGSRLHYAGRQGCKYVIIIKRHFDEFKLYSFFLNSAELIAMRSSLTSSHMYSE